MKKDNLLKQKQSAQRARRTRGKLRAVSSHPRLSVFRTSKHIRVQIIDDAQGKTLAASSDQSVDVAGKKPVEVARLVGEDIGARAKKAGITQVVFDRGPYRYHGRVLALAEGARNAGLEF